MTNELVLAGPLSPEANPEAVGLTPIQLRLRQMTLDSVPSAHSRRNYGRALDDLFLFAQSQPLSRELLMEWRAKMEGLAPSTINVRLSAVRKMVHEARRNGMVGVEDATDLTDVPNIRQQGTRLGNWLTRKQTKELLAVPDRSTLKGLRDYVILALLVGCALRRQELASLYRRCPDARGTVGDCRPPRKGRQDPNRGRPRLGEEWDRGLDRGSGNRQRQASPTGREGKSLGQRGLKRLGGLVSR
jgi:site-specific recombinase XerC